MADERKITAGPSKFDLMLGLFDSPGASPRWVEFTLGEGKKLLVCILLVEKEDGSAESWMITAFEKPAPTKLFSENRVTFYYSTKTRKGYMMS